MTNPNNFSEDFKTCIKFHGHVCPGLTYGYLVAKEAIRLLNINKSVDEEIVAICENDSCAVDALQILLGTTAGKGNLKIENYGKNAFTIMSRKSSKGYRFSRKSDYKYKGRDSKLFNSLEAKMKEGTITPEERATQKKLKTYDLLAKPFSDVFETEEIKYQNPPFAELAPSKPCSECGEMTMASKLTEGEDGKLYCTPCLNGNHA